MVRWLWGVHNRVSTRLKGESEIKALGHETFPARRDCPQCLSPSSSSSSSSSSFQEDAYEEWNTVVYLQALYCSPEGEIAQNNCSSQQLKVAEQTARAVNMMAAVDSQRDGEGMSSGFFLRGVGGGESGVSGAAHSLAKSLLSLDGHSDGDHLARDVSDAAHRTVSSASSATGLSVLSIVLCMVVMALACGASLLYCAGRRRSKRKGWGGGSRRYNGGSSNGAGRGGARDHLRGNMRARGLRAKLGEQPRQSLLPTTASFLTQSTKEARY